MKLKPMKGLLAELSRWTEEEREGLAKILKSPASDPRSLAHHFRWIATDLIEFNFSDGPTYKEVVSRVAKKLEIERAEKKSISVLEAEISQAIFETTWEKMKTSERKRFETELLKSADGIKKDDIKRLLPSAGLSSALGAAQMSGFGVYLLASTSLSTLTGAVGLTLPFVAYTAASRAIAVAIGPVGWLVTGVLAAFQLSGASWKKMIPAVVYICMIRNSPRTEGRNQR